MSTTKTNRPDIYGETIFMTPAAVAEVKKLLAEQPGDKEKMLRVGVVGGGCSGLSYTMTLDDKAEEFDRVIEIDGVKVVIDEKSLLYMGGTTIDFVKEMLTGGFRFNNPRSVRGCGCGTSFSV